MQINIKILNYYQSLKKYLIQNKMTIDSKMDSKMTSDEKQGIVILLMMYFIQVNL